MRARTQTINALKALLVTAPAELREQLRGLPATRLVRAAATLEPGTITSPLAAAMLALRTLAGRHQALSAEINTLTTELDRLTAKAAPKLVALFGVGQDSAGALLVAAGDNPDRLRSDAAFSMLCGVSPIEASSGKPSGTGSCREPWWLIAAGVPGCMACPAGLGRRHKFGSERSGMPDRLVRLIASLAPATAPD